MAEYINMQQAEYDEIQNKLTTLHEEILEREERIREDILELVDTEGGFYVENISSKITGLLRKLKRMPIQQMKEAFKNTEKQIEVFVQTVVEIDVLEN